MIIAARDGKSFDTDRDLTAPECHILQELIIWQLFASSVDQFRERVSSCEAKMSAFSVYPVQGLDKYPLFGPDKSY